MRRATFAPGTRHLLAVIAACALALGGAAPTAWAGAPPHRLDQNLGFVIPAPRIHNIFWDSNWNADNPNLTTGSIDTFTSRLTTNGYLNGLGQYGVGASTFA